MRVGFPAMKRALVAILRGLDPRKAESVVATLIEAGFEAIEIPLNSPEPYHSIEAAVRVAPEDVLVGAGTVLDTAAVERLRAIGARLVVSPNVVPDVIGNASRHGMVTMPGVFTATEAFTALDAGASALKFFPASVMGPAGLSAIRAVLPNVAVIAAVGGVSDEDFLAYAAVGISTFGLGSSLFKPEMTLDEIKARAHRTVSCYDEVFGRR